MLCHNRHSLFFTASVRSLKNYLSVYYRGVNRAHKVGYHRPSEAPKVIICSTWLFQCSWNPNQRSPITEFEEDSEAVQGEVEVRIQRVIILRYYVDY